MHALIASVVSARCVGPTCFLHRFSFGVVMGRGLDVVIAAVVILVPLLSAENIVHVVARMHYRRSTICLQEATNSKSNSSVVNVCI